jgi:hypothetical protein
MKRTLDESGKLVNKRIDEEEMDIFKNERSCCKQEEVESKSSLLGII